MKNLTVGTIVRRAMISGTTLYSNAIISFIGKNPVKLERVIKEYMSEHQQDIYEDITASLKNKGMLLEKGEVIDSYVKDMKNKVLAQKEGVPAHFMSDLHYQPNGMVATFHGYQISNMEELLREAVTRMLLERGDIFITP